MSCSSDRLSYNLKFQKAAAAAGSRTKRMKVRYNNGEEVDITDFVKANGQVIPYKHDLSCHKCHHTFVSKDKKVNHVKNEHCLHNVCGWRDNDEKEHNHAMILEAFTTAKYAENWVKEIHNEEDRLYKRHVSTCAKEKFAGQLFWGVYHFLVIFDFFPDHSARHQFCWDRVYLA